jgi:peptidoglycan lytic transglycosylase
MCSISYARTSRIDLEANRVHLNAPAVSYSSLWSVVQLLVLALGAASLAACAQSSVVGPKSPPVEANRSTSVVTNRRVAVASPLAASGRGTVETQVASHGLASFYTEGTQTANGERFDTHQLTAAHRTLPFGTRLRVTNVTSGRSVTVRVNDRGPFIPGRVVDVSYSAAETLGIVGKGIAKVKLDVVE